MTFVLERIQINITGKETITIEPKEDEQGLIKIDENQFIKFNKKDGSTITIANSPILPKEVF
jgi:hypothetical protein